MSATTVFHLPRQLHPVPSAEELHEAVYGPTPVPMATIYRRRRVAFLMALAVAGLLLWSLVAALTSSTAAPAAEAPAAAEAVEPTIHVVQPGDTLWSIAATVDTDGDIRDTVDRLAERNGGSALEVGQRLVLD